MMPSMMPKLMRSVVAQGRRSIVPRRQFTTSSHVADGKEYSLFAEAGSAGVVILGIDGFRRYTVNKWDKETEMDLEKMEMEMEMENDKLEAELDADIEKLKMQIKKLKMAKHG